MRRHELRNVASPRQISKPLVFAAIPAHHAVADNVQVVDGLVLSPSGLGIFAALAHGRE